jgi:hypothetical protein
MSAAVRLGLKLPGEFHLSGGIDMNKTLFAVLPIGVALLFISGLVVADNAATQTLARVTMNLNHFPSDEDKVALKAIIDSDDSSEEEAAIAMALVNMQHKVTEADADRLADIVGDDESDATARKLAGIVLGINHAPSDDDKAALAALAGQ